MSVLFTLCALMIKSVLQALRPSFSRLTADRKVRTDRTPLREFFGQHAPLAAAPKQIQYCTEHLVHVDSPETGFSARAFQQRLDDFELIAANVAWVAISHPPELLMRLEDFEHVLSSTWMPCAKLRTANCELRTANTCLSS